MLLNYSELKYSVNHIREQFIVKDAWKFGKVQKIFSSGKVVVMSVRVPGKTINLAIGRGGEACGVWALDRQVPSAFRIVRDKFLEFLRSNIQGLLIDNVKIDSLDRIVELRFIDGSKLLMFWKGRSLYFSFGQKIESGFEVFSPWIGQKKYILENLEFDIFDQIERREIERKDIENISSPDFFSEEVVKVSPKKIKRKIQNINKDLELCMQWRFLNDKLQANAFTLEERIFNYNGIKVKFETTENFYQRRDKIFQKIKKLKNGENILRKRLEDTKNEEQNIAQQENVDQKIYYPVWMIKEAKVSSKKVQRNDIEIFHIGEVKYGVGLSANGNDYLRSKWSTKSDIWVHLDVEKSAHVIIKTPKSVTITELEIAASIVADYSSYKDEQIPIIYTQVKDVKGVKGSPGLVIYKKEKHLRLRKTQWKEIISSSWLE